MADLIIRRVEVQDAATFMKMQEALDCETKFMMFEPGERSQDIKRIENLIQHINEQSDLLLVAEVENEMVGFIMAQQGTYERIRHRAYIVLGIREALQGQGIGKRFFKELDRWAIKQQLKRLELTVMKHNVKALRLYETNGFVIEGVKKDSMYVDKQYVDEYYMAKLF